MTVAFVESVSVAKLRDARSETVADAAEVTEMLSVRVRDTDGEAVVVICSVQEGAPTTNGDIAIDVLLAASSQGTRSCTTSRLRSTTVTVAVC